MKENMSKVSSSYHDRERANLPEGNSIKSLSRFPAAKGEVIVPRSRRSFNAQTATQAMVGGNWEDIENTSNQEVKSTHSQEAHNPVPVNSKLDLANPVPSQGGQSQRTRAMSWRCRRMSCVMSLWGAVGTF